MYAVVLLKSFIGSGFLWFALLRGRERDSSGLLQVRRYHPQNFSSFLCHEKFLFLPYLWLGVGVLCGMHVVEAYLVSFQILRDALSVLELWVWHSLSAVLGFSGCCRRWVVFRNSSSFLVLDLWVLLPWKLLDFSVSVEVIVVYFSHSSNTGCYLSCFLWAGPALHLGINATRLWLQCFCCTTEISLLMFCWGFLHQY